MIQQMNHSLVNNHYNVGYPFLFFFLALAGWVIIHSSKRKRFIFCLMETMVSAATVAANVAIIQGIKISVGLNGKLLLINAFETLSNLITGTPFVGVEDPTLSKIIFFECIAIIKSLLTDKE